MNLSATDKKAAIQLLREVGVSPRHLGYRILGIAIPMYARNEFQGITKELYPSLAEHIGRTPGAVERTIRYAIGRAWENGSRAAWERFFPGLTEAPSNMVFIIRLSEYLSV